MTDTASTHLPVIGNAGPWPQQHWLIVAGTEITVIDTARPSARADLTRWACLTLLALGCWPGCRIRAYQIKAGRGRHHAILRPASTQEIEAIREAIRR